MSSTPFLTFLSPGGSRRHDRELAGDAGALAADRRQSGRPAADVEQTYLRAVAVLALALLTQLFAAVLRLGSVRVLPLPPLGLPFEILLVDGILQIQLLRGGPEVLSVLLVAQSQLAAGRRIRAYKSSVLRLYLLLLILARLL